jgi:hypothetical protein
MANHPPDGGLVLLRELDERLGFSELIEQHLTDLREKNTPLPLADLLSQSIYSRMAGYEDVNVSSRRVHHHEFGNAVPGGGAVLQQARHGGAADVHGIADFLL